MNAPVHNLMEDSVIKETDALLQRLFPICRSITGDGVRQSLSILHEIADFDIKEIPSGTRCYDWTVPDEWNVRDAYVEDSSGKKVIDFQKNNLHLVSYSVPIDKKMSFQELEKHLHTLPRLADAIPYRTAYYDGGGWGFCLSHNQLEGMDKNDEYYVKIDSSLKPGKLTYGECVINGKSGQEFLISTYCCHPSLANDNLSGMVLWTLLIRELASWDTRHTYRFIIIPETIGSIAYLSQNEEAMKKVDGGFILTSVAGPSEFGYKPTYLGNSLIDKIVHNTFNELGMEYVSYPFDINSDERQYSSPEFRIPMGTICKDKYSEYIQYHTSLDNLDFISAENLIKTLKIYLAAIRKLEMNLTYTARLKCEPMLSKRGLYPKIGGMLKQGAAAIEKNQNELDANKWVLFYSDGKTSLVDIAEKTKIPIKELYESAEKLRENKLLEVKK